MTPADGVAFLAEQRKVPDRSQSAKVVAVGEELLASGTLNKIGDEVWPALEQLAYAALDIGHRDLAIACIERVAYKFPESSRTTCLQGALLEVGPEPEAALKLYDAALLEDPADVLVAKRRIALLRSQGQNEQAIEALTKLVDNFYSDSEAWLELASLYTEVGLLDRACFALEECVLLQPTNSFFNLQLAETLYTSGNINRAYKTFLQVIELDVDPADDGHPPAAGGPRLRALWGLKLCALQLLAGKVPKAEDESTTPERVPAINKLADKLLLQAYAVPTTGEDTAGLKNSRGAVRAVLASSKPE